MIHGRAVESVDDNNNNGIGLRGAHSHLEKYTIRRLGMMKGEDDTDSNSESSSKSKSTCPAIEYNLERVKIDERRERVSKKALDD